MSLQPWRVDRSEACCCYRRSAQWNCRYLPLVPQIWRFWVMCFTACWAQYTPTAAMLPYSTNRSEWPLLHFFVLLFSTSTDYLSYSAVNCAVRNMTNLLFWSSQGGVKTILTGFHNILSHTDPSFTGLLFLLAYICLIWHCRILFTMSHLRKTWQHSVCSILRFFSPAVDISTGSLGFKCHPQYD